MKILLIFALALMTSICIYQNIVIRNQQRTIRLFMFGGF